jgi:primosomal protein N' (replication factor Y)
VTGPRFARVALPLPVAEPYRYLIPATIADRAVLGARAVVPVRQQEMIGIITGVDDTPPPGAAREILTVPDDTPALTPPLLSLAEEAARHWGAPPGLMLRAMLPAPLWGRTEVSLRLTPGGERARLGGTAGDLLAWLQRRDGGQGSVRAAAKAVRRPAWEPADRLRRLGLLTIEAVPPDVRGGARAERVAVLTGEPLTLVERDDRFRRARAQRALYESLEQAGGRLAVAVLLERAGVTPGPLGQLVKAGLVAIEEAESIRDPFADLAGTPPPATLLPAQREALAALAALPPGGEALLYGVTGSGKTAVYLERVRQLLAEDRGAILLVPEIALTPQTVARVRGAFGDAVAVLHSGLSDNERADAWRLLRRGERRVAVGARSAVFAPVERLGVIVLDEEHEGSYKNGETPRYHARDVARMRARLEGATLILGTATPSVESWARTRTGIARIDLPARVADRPMPPVDLVDLRHEPLVSGGALPWSTVLDQAVGRALDRKEQVLLLLNRRGWSTFIQCTACGVVVECPQCSIALTLHHDPDHLRCHYCDHRAAPPAACPTCGGGTIQHRGAGTQQLERLVAERFPEARLARMDLDTTGTRWSHHRILERVGRGEVDVLLGTQMIAKGIDFPNVTLVGVVDADTALHLPDFRAAERTFQLVAQVAGRAGRGPLGGRVLVQTRQPEHPALQCAARHDATAFLDAELAAREMPPYPPTVALARVVASGPEEAEVDRQLAIFAAWCERAIAASRAGLVVLGPATCPIPRIRGESRSHVLVRGAPRALGAWVRTVGPRLTMRRGGVRFTLDRDPVAML